MTPDLWTRFADTVYGSHPWDGFSAYCRFDDGMTVVTTSGYHGGDDTWTIGLTFFVEFSSACNCYGHLQLEAISDCVKHQSEALPSIGSNCC